VEDRSNENVFYEATQLSSKEARKLPGRSTTATDRCPADWMAFWCAGWQAAIGAKPLLALELLGLGKKVLKQKIN
jgi:hypothetical protein